MRGPEPPPRGEDILFETSRIRARHLSARDVDAMLAVYGDPESMRWVGDGSPLDRAGCVRWVEVTLVNYERRGYGMSALVARRSGEVIGFCGIVHPGGQPEAEIKFALRPEFRGRGLATEAVDAMLEYGARRFGLSEIVATVAPGNAASQRVLKKVGMVPAGSRREDDGSTIALFAWRPAAPPDGA